VRLADDYAAENFTTGDGAQDLAAAMGQTAGTRVKLADDYAVPNLESGDGRRIVVAGDFVQLADDYAGGGVAGAVYRYVGTGPALIDLSVENYVGASWVKVGGDAGMVYEYVGLGATGVDLGLVDYGDGAQWELIAGTPGSVYQYMGTTDTIDLSGADYTDLAFWKLLPITQLIPQGYNIGDSNAIAVGGLVVMNEVRAKVEAY
jgi:hypothetical protein